MIKLVLCDDEPRVRSVIKSYIDLEKLGIVLIGEACDGDQLIALCDKTDPDIIITDIKMPGINGIELIKHLSKYRSKIIFISGYDNFGYAKSAVAAGAFDYLLKPIDKNELVNILSSLCTLIAQERQQKQNENNMKNELMSMYAVLEEKLVIEFLMGDHNDFSVITQIHKNCADGRIQYRVILIKAESSLETSKNILTHINSALYNIGKSFMNIYDDSEIIIITYSEFSENQIFRLMSKIQHIISAHTNLEVYIIIGAECTQSNYLRKNYNLVRNGICYLRPQTCNRVFFEYQIDQEILPKEPLIKSGYKTIYPQKQ